jgi:hypothetical protein
MNAPPSSPLPDTAAIRCPLGRVAIVRGGDAEAREGGGFYAARKNGIHGAPHFAYIRAAAGTVDGNAATLAKIKDSADGLDADFAQDSILAGVAGVLHPAWAVRFLKCWDDPSPAVAPSSTGRTVGRQPRE